MKYLYLSLILFSLLLTSCSSTKKTVEKPPKETVQTSIPEKSQTPEKKEDNSNTNISEEAIFSTETFENETTLKTSEAFNHSIFNSLLQKHVSNAGNVNYKNIKAERSILTNYIKSLGENMPTNNWSKENKLAYWINAYNAMTIDLILRHYPIKSIKDIKDPWKQRYWKLSDKWYNLDEIEHQIIRKMNEPRIHFALVCAAVSCPKLYNNAFTASTLEADLTKLTREFLADTSKNNISKNNLKLSKIFSWFTKDFKQDGSLLEFLNKYTSIEISKHAKKQFNTYSWALNE